MQHHMATSLRLQERLSEAAKKFPGDDSNDTNGCQWPRNPWMMPRIEEAQLQPHSILQAPFSDHPYEAKMMSMSVAMGRCFTS